MTKAHLRLAHWTAVSTLLYYTRDVRRETKNIQYSVKVAMTEFSAVLADLVDATATMDEGNCGARADVKVDGTVVMAAVPVTHLLFLEKQLTDIQTFVSHAAVLDPAESWKWDEGHRVLPQRSLRHQQDKKENAEPCEIRGHGEASRPGGDLH